MKLLLIARQVLLAVYLFGMVACNGNEEGKDTLLSKKPYRGLTDSIRQFSQNHDLYLQRGLMLSQNNEHELAHRDYAKAFEISPTEPVILLYVSNLLTLNKVKQAVDLLQQTIHRFPENVEFRRRLSDVYIETNEYRKALEEYNSMLAIDSFDFETWHNKGAVLVQLKDTTAGIEAFERSFAIQPIQYTGLKLADIYASMKNPRALVICDQILARDTTTVATDALFAKGVYYAETKQYKKALKVFDSCISHEWTMVDAHIEKGIIYFQQQQYQDALKVFTTASTVSNTHADAWFWLGRCFEALGEHNDAIENYNRAISLDPYFHEAKARRKRLQG